MFLHNTIPWFLKTRAENQKMKDIDAQHMVCPLFLKAHSGRETFLLINMKKLRIDFEKYTTHPRNRIFKPLKG